MHIGNFDFLHTHCLLYPKGCAIFCYQTPSAKLFTAFSVNSSCLQEIMHISKEGKRRGSAYSTRARHTSALASYALPHTPMNKEMSCKKTIKQHLLGFGCKTASVCFRIFSVHCLVMSARLAKFSKWASSSVFSAPPSFSSVYCRTWFGVSLRLKMRH